jgi:Arc/MetJ family transcription regulator
MTEITAHLDEAELAEAQELLGTASVDETLQAAVRRAVADVKRKRALAEEMSPETAAVYARMNDLPAA